MTDEQMQKLATEELAARILVSLYSNQKTEAEDYKHNAIIAIRAAQVFKETLGTTNIS